MKILNHTSCILLVLLTTVHYFFSSSAARSPGNETDRMTLPDIKLQMSDPNGLLNSWNDSQHHCQWPGVSCDMHHHRVIALTLGGKSLSGTISSHLGNLSFIKVVHLGGNSLHGGIPQQIGQLSRLRSFNLSRNLLSGEIPINLTRCSNLIHIDLRRNQLSGIIPAELGSLKKLAIFVVYLNNLTGTIPASLGNLSTSLNALALGENNLEGYIPNELGSLSRLTDLILGPNLLRGEIPSSLFNISTLVLLAAASNSFSGKLPTNIGLNLPNLFLINVAQNNLYGEIPISITNCTNLEQISLFSNNFEGKVIPGLDQLLNLQILDLTQNFLGGNIMGILESLTNCTKLRILSLGRNNFSGELPNTIGNLSSQLTRIYLGYNSISGTIPMELEKLVRLEILKMRGNSLTGVIPENLVNLQNLEVLALNMNRLSGQIPPTLCSNVNKLFDLRLSENNLEGDLNHSLANCQRLQWIYISKNNLSGIFPSHIFGSYISPSEIVLSSNSLSGALPLEVGNLANLRVLDLSNNNLSGSIPSTISGCLIIESFDVHGNNFSGSLPPSLVSLKGLEHLDLSDNSLTGFIPGGLKQLLYLNYLNLSYNDLEGKVPTDGVFSNISRIMLQGNSKLCGGISELGLPACPIVYGKTKKEKNLKTILIPIFSVLVISIALILYLIHRNKIVKVRTRMPSIQSKRMLRVSYHDLYRATNKFSPASMIGSGSFGFVYKGTLVVDHREISVVAIKVLDLRKRGASKSFVAECKALSNLRHRYVLPLLTYCSSIDHKGDEFKALVYKYMENGNLDTWLHLDQRFEPPRSLNLLQRLNIATDVALALDHLHNHSHTAVAHCDVKPSNILLDDQLTAYVGDFGLARFLPQLQQAASSSTVAIKGSIGYAAPEYAMGLEVSTQGDIYSYGILLLEMFTGRRPTDDAFTGDLNLHNYVKAGLSDQVWEVVDPSLLSGEAHIESTLNAQECIISALKLGIECSQAAAKDRKDMKQVIRELHFIRDAFYVA